jgi:hypothetical protein
LKHSYLVLERVYNVDGSVGCLTGLVPEDNPEKEVCDESPLTGNGRAVGGGGE